MSSGRTSAFVWQQQHAAAFLLNCVLVLCFCSDKPGFLGEHDSEFSLGSTGTSAKVLARDLCHLPGVCGHVLGLRFAAIVCAARFGFWLLVGFYWIFEGVLVSVACGSEQGA